MSFTRRVVMHTSRPCASWRRRVGDLVNRCVIRSLGLDIVCVVCDLSRLLSVSEV